MNYMDEVSQHQETLKKYIKCMNDMADVKLRVTQAMQNGSVGNRVGYYILTGEELK